MSQSVSSIHTSCKNCVFAQYENITQTGCSLDYIDKLKKNNTEILEAYDDSKEFYIINNKKCIGYRENKWFDQFENCSSLEDKISIYHKHNTLSYVAVINLSQLSHSQLDHILYELSTCVIGPRKIILIRYRDSDQKFKIDLIKDYLQKNNLNCMWRMQTILDDTEEYDKILNNITTTNHEYRFVLSITDDSTELPQLVKQANQVVHEEMGQFIILSNADHSNIIYASSVYRYSRVVEGRNILKQKELYQYI